MISQFEETGHSPRFNALRHGLRSAAVMLPGDDAAAYRKLRHELFHTYQPGTRDEADCVEGLAGYKWRIAHCQRMQAAFKVALAALVTGGPAGHICEPDPHRWQHRSMDCVLEEQRLHRLMVRDRRTLFELQSMRRNRLIDGAIAVVADYREFLADGEPAHPEENAAAAGPLRVEGDLPTAGELEAGALPAATPPATGSHDGQNGEIRKSTAARALQAPLPRGPEPGGFAGAGFIAVSSAAIGIPAPLLPW